MYALIWLLPLSRYATGSLALLFTLAEVGFWIEQAARFDFSQSDLPCKHKGPLTILNHSVRLTGYRKRAGEVTKVVRLRDSITDSLRNCECLLL